LGSKDFLNEILNKTNQLEEAKARQKIPLNHLLEKVAAEMNIKKEELLSSSQKRQISKARSLFCYLAIKK